MTATLNIGIIGGGRLGTALGIALAARGYWVRAIASRTRASAEKLADRLGPGTRACPSAHEAARISDLVFITTPDDAIAGVAERVKWRADHQVVHCSGALSVDVLRPVVEKHGHVASFHPLQSFAKERADPFVGVTIGLGGDGVLLDTLQGIAEDLGARWIVVPSEGKAAYHASAVLISNYVVTLMKASFDLLAQLGIPEKDAQAALTGLLGGTLANLQDMSIPQALTGPIARGDTGTVRRHLDTLAANPPVADAYRVLGRLAIPLAQAKGTLNDTAAAELSSLLSTPSGDIHKPQAPRGANPR